MITRYADPRPDSGADANQQALKRERMALRASLAATSQPVLMAKLALAGAGNGSSVGRIGNPSAGEAKGDH